MKPQCKPRVGSYVQRWADAVSLLVKRPRTQQELMELTGVSRHAIRRVLYALKDEGLLLRLQRKKTERDGRGSSPDLWTWAP